MYMYIVSFHWQLSWIRQGLNCPEFSFTQFPGNRKLEIGSFIPPHPDEEPKNLTTWFVVFTVSPTSSLLYILYMWYNGI